MPCLVSRLAVALRDATHVSAGSEEHTILEYPHATAQDEQSVSTMKPQRSVTGHVQTR